MAITLQDVFAVMDGDKEIRDVTDPSVADAVTGKALPTDDILKVGDNFQSVPDDAPVLAKVSPETGGVAFTDEQTFERSKQPAQPKAGTPATQTQLREIGIEDQALSQRQSMLMRQYINQERARINEQIKNTPDELKQSAPSTSAPMTTNADILDSSAFNNTANVHGQENKQAFYTAHAMLVGDTPFNTEQYIEARKILERQASGGNKAARRYLNEFDAYFAEKASEFRFASFVARTAGDAQQANQLVMQALDETFGGDRQLKEAFLRSGGTEILNEVFKEVGVTGTYKDKQEAEGVYLAQEKVRADIAYKRQSAASKMIGAGSYTGTQSVGYTPDATGEVRDAEVEAINRIIPEGGTTIKSYEAFKKQTLDNATAGANISLRNTQDIIENLGGSSRYASAQDIKDDILEYAESHGIDTSNPQALYHAVVTHDGGRAFDALSGNIVSAAQAQNRASYMNVIEQWAQIENTTGDVQGLSPSLADKTPAEYSKFYDKGITMAEKYFAMEGVSVSPVEKAEMGRIIATHMILSGMSPEAKGILPATKEQLASAPSEIRQVYAMVNSKLNEVEQYRDQYTSIRRNDAEIAYVEKYGAAPREQWTSFSWPNYESGTQSNRTIYAPEALSPAIEAIIRTNSDEQAAKILDESVGPDGILNVEQFREGLRGRQRVLENIDLSASYPNKTDRLRAEDYYARLSEDNFTDIETPQNYFVNPNVMTAEQSNHIADAMSWLDPDVQGGQTIQGMKGWDDTYGEKGEPLSPTDRVKSFVAALTGLEPDVKNDAWNLARKDPVIWNALTNGNTSVERERGVILLMNKMRTNQARSDREDISKAQFYVGVIADNIQQVTGTQLDIDLQRISDSDSPEVASGKRLQNEEATYAAIIQAASGYDLKDKQALLRTVNKYVVDSIDAIGKRAKYPWNGHITPDSAVQERIDALNNFVEEVNDVIGGQVVEELAKAKEYSSRGSVARSTSPYRFSQ